MPIRTILAAVVAAVAVVAGAHAQSGPTDCGKLSATHGRGATWRHYSAKIELDGTGATCDEARSVVAAWLNTDEPDQGEWFCQSSHGAAAETFIGGCEHFPGGDLSAPPDATVTAEGSFDVAVARACGGSLHAYAIKCRVARKIKTRAARAPSDGGCAVLRDVRVRMKAGCRVAGYRCKDHPAGAYSSKIRCQRGRKREAAFRL